MVPLSVLDLSPIAIGTTAGDALRNSLELARHAERFGYTRYWVAEHHNMTGIASAYAGLQEALVNSVQIAALSNYKWTEVKPGTGRSTAEAPTSSAPTSVGPTSVAPTCGEPSSLERTSAAPS